MTPRRRLFVLLYAVSGAAALVYEVTWTRLFSLQLGHTVAAASTVLAAFMGGLALGAWIARSSGTGLRIYAVLEALIGLFALLLPVALRATVPLLAWSYADGTASAQFAMTRIVVSLVLLGIPAAAMGATFPIATRWFASVSADAGVLYAANTAGAAVGALAAGFWLIPAIGLRGTTWIGVALNAIAACGAMWIARQPHAEAAKPAEKDSHKKKAQRLQRAPRDVSSPRIAFLAVGISGFAALVYEVAWTRLLAMIIGPTTYAFATMAAAFVTGLAVGSAVGTRISRTATHLVRWLGAMLIVSAVTACAAASFAAIRLPLITAAQVADANVTFGSVVTTQALLVTLLLLPMTFALGATFPLALAVASTGADSIAGDTARVYTANTVGAIGGALAGGFVLIPLLGLRWTFAVAAIVAAVAGASCVANLVFAGVAVAAIVAIVALPSWDNALLSSGAYKYAPYLAGTDLETVLRVGRLEYYKEGAAGTVSVRRLTGTLSLAIDGKVDASNTGDMLTQRMLGLLPVLIHGHAHDLCIIGLGSGVTAASALAPGTVTHEDVIEISPEVVEASHYFDTESEHVLQRPEVRLIAGDGRSHLLLTPRRYDVIVSEPSNPWMAGVASLFTREFFEAAKSKLNADGLLCQWAHTYDISREDLQSIVRTFNSVFPQGTAWLVGEGDVLLVGARDGDIASRLGAIASGSRNGRTAAMLSTLGALDGTTPFAVFASYVAGPHELARFASDAPVQDDDRTLLEYSAPRGIYGHGGTDNAAALRGLSPELPPAVRTALDGARDIDWASRGKMELKAEAYTVAYDAFHKALAINSRNAVALEGLSDAAAGTQQQAQQREWLKALVAREPSNVPARLELSRLLAATGDFQDAIDTAAEALRQAPDDPKAGEQLLSVLADAGDAERLMSLAEAFAQHFPNRPSGAYYRASALFLAGKTEDAIRTVRQVVDSHPKDARAQNLLGAACATAGQADCARSAFDASIRANPRDPSTYVNAGLFRLRSADARAAAEYFGEALTIDPHLAAARSGLAQARSALGSNPQ
ncbi:MAG TPA: fused MFS/spermidine synthase [Vicinamibacterales bacterium]|nr:fused MFS/spermidine synthase [Vicinamibacterales bacterium]